LFYWLRFSVCRLAKRPAWPSALARENPELTNLLRKHGGKTGEELKVAQPKPPPIPPTDKAPDIHDAAMYGDIEAAKQRLASGSPHMTPAD
jgi:hypothetical protein